jgi:hypothetical protein
MERHIFQFAVFFCFAIGSFFWGFTRLRRKRLIENIPTSTIRGLALGLVELTGRARKEHLLKSPFTGADCVFYRYTVERYQGSGKSARWVTVAKGDSSSCPFLIDDGTGKIRIFPQAAELVMPMDYNFTSMWLKPITPNLIDFMQRNGISYRGFLGNCQMRFREWYITENENVYVLGTANKPNDFLKDHKGELLKRLGELKNDAVFMEKVDTNKDGNVSQDEWDAAVKKVEQEIIQKEIEAGQSDNAFDVIISGTGGNVFIISDHSQKELTRKLTLQAFIGIFGGGALAVFLLYLLLLSFFEN